MNIYDFDRTIYKRDSSFEFFFWILKRYPGKFYYVIIFLWVTGLYLLGRRTKVQAKESMWLFLRDFEAVDQEIDLFWQHRTLQPWYRNRQREDDVIISASPRFLIEKFLQQQGVSHIIASEVDEKTGIFLSKNCYGQEKVVRFKQEFGDITPRRAYSDSLSDLPMLKLAESAFIVDGSPQQLASYRPSLPLKLKQHFASREFLLFLAIGSINTVNGIIFAYLFSLVIPDVNLAFTCGYAVSVTISYILNSRAVFREKMSLEQYVKFVLSYFPNFLIQSMCVVLFYNALGVSKLITYIIAAILGVPITFLAVKIVAFQRRF